MPNRFHKRKKPRTQLTLQQRAAAFHASLRANQEAFELQCLLAGVDPSKTGLTIAKKPVANHQFS